MFSLKNKVIVVTGGQGLLGSEIIKALKEQEATAISADIETIDSDDLNIHIDITKEESIKAAIETLVTKYGKIDGWVNNAYPRTADWGNKLEDIPYASWQKNIDMHLNGYFLCCRAALEQMKQQGFGSLINMSSIYGLVGPDFTIYDGTEMTTPAAYAVIKGAINNFTRYLASYYGPSQVRVNTVSPGGIFDNQAKSFVDSYNAKVPLKKMGRPEDVAASVCFLLADEASYITGHNLLVDGGWSII